MDIMTGPGDVTSKTKTVCCAFTEPLGPDKFVNIRQSGYYK